MNNPLIDQLALARAQTVAAGSSALRSAPLESAGIRANVPLSRPGVSGFWLGAWLAIVMILAKVAHFGTPWRLTGGERLDYFRDVATACAGDVLFALTFGFAGHCLLRAASRAPKLRKVIATAWLVLGCFFAFYAVASVYIFDYVGAPLSYPLLYLAGDATNMRSSVTAFVTPMRVATLIAVPVAYVFVAYGLRPRTVAVTRRSRHWRAMGIQCACLGGAVLYTGWASHAVDGDWGDRPDWRIIENPHWAFISSFWSRNASGRTIQIDQDFSPDDVADFQTVAERDPAPAQLASATSFGRRPRNVIVLVLESTATRYLSVYGSKYDTTPCLQAEAAHSLVFDNCYSHCGNTANSLAALNLSIYPGMTWRKIPVEQPNIRGTTLADVLHPHGYRTAFISSGDNSYGNQDGFLKNRGFDTVWDCGDLSRDTGCPRIFSWGVEDRCMFESILRWVDKGDKDKPFFVMGWTQQTHHPYETTPGKPVLNLIGNDKVPEPESHNDYLNCVRTVDEQIGRLFEGLRKRGMADDTLVVITGDHGEAFGEPHDTWGHSGTTYQEDVNVPLILWNPALFKGGHRDTVCGHVDVNATVVDVLGIPTAGTWQGHSLFDAENPQRAFFYGAKEQALGVRDGRWKYVYKTQLNRDELFDLSADRDELKNVAKDHPDVCTRLRQRLAAWASFEEGHLVSLR